MSKEQWVYEAALAFAEQNPVQWDGFREWWRLNHRLPTVVDAIVSAPSSEHTVKTQDTTQLTTQEEPLHTGGPKVRRIRDAAV